MINLSLKKQQGAATFLITTLLVISITLIVIFAANYSIMQQKMNANANRSQQAFEAAEAGLEFGINYLRKNSATILATKSGGFVQPYSDSSTSNVTLANGSKYTIAYTNPVANNYNLILISSTGVNDDGTATRVVSQLVKFGSTLYSAPTAPLIVKGVVTLSGSSQIVNTTSNSTVTSGGSVSFSGSAQTTISSGIGSNASHTGTDVTQSNSTLANKSANNLFASYFGVSSTTVKNNANYTFTNLGNYNSSLNGLSGGVIWIDQTSSTAVINGSTVVGSSTNPVILIVNGNFQLSGSAVIYGLVFVTGADTTDSDITGNGTINGALITSGALDLKGSTVVNFNQPILNTIQSQTSYYAKVPGSWRDF